MNKSLPYLLLTAMTLLFAASCENDDTDFSTYALVTTDDEDEDDELLDTTDTIYVVYNAASASVAGDTGGKVSVSGADVTVTDTATTCGLVLVLSGSTDDGSLLVYRSRKYTIVLNGVSITNPDGAAINNQCSKSLYIVCPEKTVNALADGTTYAEQTYDQKGTLFSEGQLYLSGAGTLNVNAHCKNGIVSDDYITIDDDVVVTINSATTATNGMKANDGMFINGGNLNINVTADGAHGIKCDAKTLVTGGTVSITTTGGCLIETVDGVAVDTTSAACIRCDSLFSISGGTMTLLSMGDGGKGIRCNENIELSGGSLYVTTTGGNEQGKPKALKSDTGIIVSGGYLNASVEKSWACDNGTDSEAPADHLTVKGTPTVKNIEKKQVEVSYYDTKQDK